MCPALSLNRWSRSGGILRRRSTHSSIAATAIFAAEYVLRAWTCVDFHDARYRDPLWGRLRYLRSFFALVDLFSVLPAVLGFLGAGDLRVLRLLRLLRMLKLIRHSTTFGLLFAVLREEAQSITALLFVLLLTVTISGSLMFMLEGSEQPGVFTSIPAAMWWAIETLTTVGYGDMVPVTAAGGSSAASCRSSASARSRCSPA